MKLKITKKKIKDNAFWDLDSRLLLKIKQDGKII